MVCFKLLLIFHIPHDMQNPECNVTETSEELCSEGKVLHKNLFYSSETIKFVSFTKLVLALPRNPTTT